MEDQSAQSIFILAFYLIKPIEEPQREVKRFKKFLETLDVKARIYISEEGINAQMSVAASDYKAFKEWFIANADYANTPIKVHAYHEHVFPRLTVKYREQIVAFGQNVNFEERAPHVKAKEWEAMLDEEDPDTIVLDVRNDYEWEVGHFENAINSNCTTFREFTEFADKLKSQVDPSKTRVMMSCTGGIRCELFSPYLKQQGFEQVYQLEGGMLQYGIDVGSKHWEGGLFVFDDRLVVPIKEGEYFESIGTCHECDTTTSLFYNCANMDCNELFLSCLECVKKSHGCCSDKCQTHGRLRPFDPSSKPKPFSRLTAEDKEKFSS